MLRTYLYEARLSHRIFSIRFAESTILFLLSYRQIYVHAEHEEGLRYLLGYHIMEVSIQPFRKRIAIYFLPFSTRN